MQYPNPSNQFNEIINLFIRNDCSIKLALSFISNNLDYILKHKEIANKIFFICNNTEIYAILIVNENNYYWSICQNNTSYPLEEKTEKNNDYIVEMIINFINEKKFQNIIPNLQEMNTETKIKALKNIKLNSKGYHIK